MKKQLKKGKKTLLTNTLITAIRHGILTGQNHQKIAKSIAICDKTFSNWLYLNTGNLRAIVDGCKVDRMLKEAERVSKEILALDPRKEGGVIDAKIFSIKQKESAFLREKLVIARESYSNSSKISKAGSSRKPVPILAGLEVV